MKNHDELDISIDERKVARVTDDPLADVAILFHALDDGELWKKDMGDWDLSRRNDAVHATDRPNEKEYWHDPPFSERRPPSSARNNALLGEAHRSPITCPHCGRLVQIIDG